MVIEKEAIKCLHEITLTDSFLLDKCLPNNLCAVRINEDKIAERKAIDAAFELESGQAAPLHNGCTFGGGLAQLVCPYYDSDFLRESGSG